MNPIGQILDYFYRVEFPQRGFPHYGLKILLSSIATIKIELKNFIDNYVTCKKDEDMPNLVNFHTHRHARTCRKKCKAICRFNFPLPLMPYTVVLDPLHYEEEKML